MSQGTYRSVISVADKTVSIKLDVAFSSALSRGNNAADIVQATNRIDSGLLIEC